MRLQAPVRTFSALTLNISVGRDHTLAEQVVILRLGHRIPRDFRITTHVCLTARAFGADGLILADVVDTALEKTILELRSRFGGDFWIRMGEPWRQVVKEWKSKGGEIAHLTAYGIPLPEAIEAIRISPSPKLVVVGAEKMPGEMFEAATWNVAVTNQPISEVSALAIFLDRYFEGKQFSIEFENAKLKIIPSARGKKVVNLTEGRN
jgi:tRNA (cytidine56-2'-O)-methyltransferase